MSFTGKATYSSGATLPEIAEDVSDVISIISPFETPLLAVLGDPMRAVTSTHHEWLEDTLLPNTDAINDGSIMDGVSETPFDVAHGDRFLAGDQIQVVGATELMLVTAVSSDTITVMFQFPLSPRRGRHFERGIMSPSVRAQWMGLTLSTG